jgi:hypothetical protein
MAYRSGENFYLKLFIEQSGLNITNIVQSTDGDINLIKEKASEIKFFLCNS